jgi:hypothetical protein
MEDISYPRRVAEDPTLKSIVKRTTAMLRLCAVKAAAHLSDPAAYPMPSDPNSIERLFSARLATRPAESQQRAKQWATQLQTAPEATRTALLGELRWVDLKSDKPVATLASASAVPLSISKLDVEKSVTQLSALKLASATASNPPKVMSATVEKANTLKVRIRQVICEDETDPQIGDDEIMMGGVTIDETGDTKKVDAFTVSNSFDSGEHKKYDPPKKFCQFDITEGDSWPKTYTVSIILAEEDWGGFPDFLNDVLKQVKSYIGTLVGGLVGGAVGGVIGAAVGAVLGFFIDLLVSAWEDDIFPAITIDTDISSRKHVFASGTQTSSEKQYYAKAFGGKYWVYLDWQLSTT